MVIDILLWLDDIRDPYKENWISEYASEYINKGEVVWVKSFIEFKNWIEQNGLPSKIAFDHDLSFDGIQIPDSEKTGYDSAKWLVEYCSKNNLKIPDFIIQSANPVGAENIRAYLNNAKKHLNL